MTEGRGSHSEGVPPEARSDGAELICMELVRLEDRFRSCPRLRPGPRSETVRRSGFLVGPHSLRVLFLKPP